MIRPPSASRFAPPTLLVARLRARLLRIVTRMIIGLGPTIGAAMLLMEPLHGRSSPFVYASLAVLLLGAVTLAVLGERQAPMRAVLAISFFFALAWTTLLHFGLVFGIAPLFLTGAVLAVVYFEWRGLVAALVAMSVETGLSSYAFASGLLPVPLDDFADPHVWQNGARSLVAVLVGLFVFGSLVAELLVGFERTIERMTSAIEGERRQREERERAHRALAQSQKLEAVGRLAGGVAHDFNNALVVILGAAEMLRADLEEAEPRFADFAADIAHAARAASDITRQLLGFSRREAGRPVDVSIDEVVEHLAKVLERLLPPTISLEVVAESERIAHLDRSQLEQVIVNLALNARDAMPDGGTLSLRSFHEETGVMPSDARIVIEVEDTGMGMDEGIRTSMFDPFFTTKDAGKGTGLGLYMARAIVENAGGTLSCTSSIGTGSTFRVELPVAEGRAREEPGPALQLTADDVRVLLVEDRSDVRTLMAEVLRGAGYRVFEASDGTSAMATLDTEGSFDILVTDAVMPGTRLTEVIHRFEATSPGAPVLICSGYVVEDLVRRGITDGAYRSLAKPFSPAELLDAVGRALAESGS